MKFPNLRTTIAIPVIVLATIALGTAAILSSFFDKSGKSADICTTIWARLIRFAAGMRLKSEGLENIDPDQTYVVVSNHQSHMDSIALYLTCPVPLRMLAKAELYKIPIFGQAIKRVGHIKVERGKTREADFSAMLEQVDALRALKRSLMVYAEGTRSNDGTLGEFKHGAFSIAKHFALPILPVAIKGTRHILPARKIRFRSGNVEVIYNKPIHPENKSAEHLRKQTRQIILSEL